MASRIAENPPLALQRTRAALQFARSGRNEELETLARDALAELIRTEDHRESVAAYLEKREPAYKGR